MLVEGLVLTQKVANSGVTRVEKAKIGLIQFCLSPPKTDVSHMTRINSEKRWQLWMAKNIQSFILSY